MGDDVVRERSLADVQRKRGFGGGLGDSVVIEENVYRNAEDAALDFAVKTDLDVMEQRRKGDHAANVALCISCARDGGVQCGGGGDCRNYVSSIEETYLSVIGHADVRLLGVRFDGRADGGDILLEGTTFIYGGVYGLCDGLRGGVDSDYHVVLTEAHTVDGKLIGVDASQFGGVLSRMNTDPSDDGKNSFEFGHMYVPGSRVVAVVRVRRGRSVHRGEEMLCDYVGEGNVNLYGGVGDHELYEVVRLKSDPKNWRANLNCVHHDGQKQQNLVCKDCGWQPVCKACYKFHRRSPVPDATREKFSENSSWRRVFAVSGLEGGVDMRRVRPVHM